MSSVDNLSNNYALTLSPAGSGAETELTSLRDWLTAAEALRGRVDWQRQPPLPGQMGSGLDILSVVLGGGGVGSLLVPLCAWLTTRRPAISIVIEKDGRKMSVDAQRASDPMAIIREAHELAFGHAEFHPDGQPDQ